jgi:hypothetical protein
MTRLAALLAALAAAQAPSPDAPLAPAGAPSSPPPASAPAPSPSAASAPPAAATVRSPAPAAAPRPLAPPRPPADPAAERAGAERAARAFLEALARGDAERLAAGAGARFSFDGALVSGADAIRARWRALLAARAAPPAPLGAVEVLPVAEATARLGPPPARLAAIVRPGTFVALGDVGGRPVVLVLAREGGRVTVLGMHD